MTWKPLTVFLAIAACFCALVCSAAPSPQHSGATPEISTPEPWASSVAEDFVNSWISGQIKTPLLADSLLNMEDVDLNSAMNFITNGGYHTFEMTDVTASPDADEFRFSGVFTGDWNDKVTTLRIVVRVTNDGGKYRVAYFRTGKRQVVGTDKP